MKVGPVPGEAGHQRHRGLAVDAVVHGDGRGVVVPGGAAAQGRVDLVRAPQGLLGAEGAQEPGPVGLLGEPVEGVDPVRPLGEITGCHGAKEGVAPLDAAHEAGGLLPVEAVEAAVEADAGAVGVAFERGHLEAGIGGRSAGADEDVAEALAAPAGDVVADAPARLQGGGHAGCHVEGAPPLGGDAVGHAADGALQVGEHVSQAVAVVLRQVEGVAAASPARRRPSRPGRRASRM